MSKHKKTQQLGMNPSTASNRLIKDIIWEVSASGCVCWHCLNPMTRDNFSIEHKVPWLDSEDPVGLYFDIDNIAYSHQTCNSAAARQPRKGTTKYPEHEGHNTRPSTIASNKRKVYDPKKRREQYLRTGS